MKKYFVGLIIIMAIGLTGCGSNSVDLTERENDMVAEYIAGKLLQYDAGYEEELIYEYNSSDENSTEQEGDDTGIATPVPVVTDAPTTKPDDPSATTVPVYLDLSKVMNATEFEIIYSKFDYYSSYPKESNNSYFTFEASKGNQLIIVEFDIKNITNQSAVLNLIGNKIEYELKADGNTTYSSLLTVLENDLSFFNMEIGASEAKKAVLAFEVPQNITFTTISMFASKDDKVAMINIK